MIKNNFYEQKIQDIKLLMQQNKMPQALEMLKTELSMPYIPLNYEQIFLQLFNEINHDQKTNDHDLKMMSSQTFMKILNSNNVLKTSFALDAIQELNLHKLAKDLKQWIENPNNNRIVKIYLLEAMSEQNINLDINFEKKVLNPSNIGSIFSKSTVINAFKKIENITHKTPFLTNLVFQNLKAFLLINYPTTDISDQDIKSLVKITNYMLNENICLTKKEQILINRIKKVQFNS